MGRFRRAWQRFTNLFTGGSPPPEPPSSPTFPDFEGEQGDTTFGEVERDLPRGWGFEGLYFANRSPATRRVVNKDPSDYQVSQADTIVVSHTDRVLGKRYFSIHGATDRKQVGSLIRTVIIPESPR